MRAQSAGPSGASSATSERARAPRGEQLEPPAALARLGGDAAGVTSSNEGSVLAEQPLEARRGNVAVLAAQVTETSSAHHGPGRALRCQRRRRSRPAGVRSRGPALGERSEQRLPLERSSGRVGRGRARGPGGRVDAGARAART